MRSSDWSSDVCSADLRDGSGRLRRRAARRPAGEPEERPQQSAEVAARETGDEPQPAMQAAGGDAAEEGADVAAESEPGAVAHEQPAERGPQPLAPRQPPGRIETAGEAGGQKGQIGTETSRERGCKKGKIKGVA